MSKEKWESTAICHIGLFPQKYICIGDEILDILNVKIFLHTTWYSQNQMLESKT